MKIAQIRDIIQAARWTRFDLVGGTREEFRRQRVDLTLNAHIAKLQALVIPARFVADIARRNEEVGYCRDVLARWHAAQEARILTAAENAAADLHIAALRTMTPQQLAAMVVAPPPRSK